MSGPRIVFYVLSFWCALGALGVITRKNAVHSAVLLIATLMGIAGIYVVMEAEFIGAVQVLVYAGGVMVLFLFVIMLVDLDQRGRKEAAVRRLSKGTLGVGAALTIGLMALLLWAFSRQPLGPAAPVAEALRAQGGNLGTVAITMFRYYLLPFELASVLLLVAMVGAVVLARSRL